LIKPKQRRKVPRIVRAKDRRHAQDSTPDSVPSVPSVVKSSVSLRLPNLPANPKHVPIRAPHRRPPTPTSTRFPKTSHGFLRLSGGRVRSIRSRASYFARVCGSLAIANPKEKFLMKRFSLALLAVILLPVAGTNLYGQGQSQNQAPLPARSRSDEMLDRWNDIGKKLIAMAQDFPEDKYDFKLQKDQRTFALNLLHAAALDFVLIRRISGSN